MIEQKQKNKIKSLIFRAFLVWLMKAGFFKVDFSKFGELIWLLILKKSINQID